MSLQMFQNPLDSPTSVAQAAQSLTEDKIHTRN